MSQPNAEILVFAVFLSLHFFVPRIRSHLDAPPGAMAIQQSSCTPVQMEHGARDRMATAGGDATTVVDATRKGKMVLVIILPPSSVITRTVVGGPSPSGLNTCIETRYCVYVSRSWISWLCERTSKKEGN